MENNKYEKETFNIYGMHCAACASAIESTLSKEKGVKEANVNYGTEKLVIEFDDKIINPDKIRKIIKQLDYDADIDNMDERTQINLENSKEKNIIKLRNTFIINLLLSIPIIYLEMGMMVGLAVPKFIEAYVFPIQFILATLVILNSLEIWVSGFKKMVKLAPNMDTLIFIATAVAYFYSIVVSIFIFMNMTMDHHIYFEVASFILVFISLGKYLESITKGRATQAIKKLIGLQPKDATIIKDGISTKIPISKLKEGDIVLVKPGEKIPADGIVIDGYTAIDEKVITGESIPVEKQIGDQVIGATINKTGAIKIEITRVGKDTLLGQIIKTVNEAIGSKAPIQLLADKVSLYFVPTVILIALASVFYWMFVGQSLSFSLSIFVAVLIIACPCALGLATPSAVMMGTGIAAKNGILIKNGKALEVAKDINIVVFDKTGTLTRGEPSVTDVVELKAGISIEDIIQISASVENNSEHPLALAIVNEAKNRDINLLNAKDFQAVPGSGVLAIINGQEIAIGTRKLMNDHNIDISLLEEEMAIFENQGKTTIILSSNKEPIGLIAIADTLKEFSIDAVEYIHKMGKKVAIISGDNKRVAESIANIVGVDTVLSEVLPHEKSLEIKRLQEEGNVVAMVGDGINDAPALAQADLGIALGSGSDIAMETGEIVLIKNDLRDVVLAIEISKYTFKKIKQNLFWAFLYNVISIPVAAGILYSYTGWLLNPSIAGAAMAFSSVSVVSNSLLMKWYKPKVIS
ncbi:heavy metal translocating P-type ATPase [Patescibacteria group bacterium]|nr:heavy metal translocating P-type ATPase [Patescibacteria group bacterium]